MQYTNLEIPDDVVMTPLSALPEEVRGRETNHSKPCHLVNMMDDVLDGYIGIAVGKKHLAKPHR